MGRVAITGMGSVNALGAGVVPFAEGLRGGHCAIGALSLFPAAGFRSTVAAEVKCIHAPEWIPRTVSRRASRSALLALVAASEAWRMACFELGKPADRPTGVVLGTTTGGLANGENAFRRNRLEKGRGSLIDWLETPVSAPTDILAQLFAPNGPRLTVSTACSSGANAIGLAADWVRDGRIEVALCGATDSLCWMTFSGFNALQALDRRPCRPFDRDRAGLSLGEGAAVFVLESWENACARGAPIMAELVSYGASADAYHLTQPRPDGLGAAEAMHRALNEGKLEAEEIDYINAHGTGTPLNDLVETRAIKEVFGNHAYRIPVTSIKSMIGHCLGAAGAIEVLASVLAMRGGFVPPTVNLENADTECDLDYVPQASRSARLGTVLSNSYGFGGNNTSVIVRLPT